MDFHKSARGVATASGLQVKQKLYRGSSNAWRNYEAFVGPLFQHAFADQAMEADNTRRQAAP